MIIIFIYREDYFYNRILRLTKDKLQEILSNKDQYYYSRKIKKKGGERNLSCLKHGTEFYKLQSNLTKNFLSKIPVLDNVYGFVKGRSYRDFLIPHTKGTKDRYYLRVDIKDFFHSITQEILIDVFKYYFRTGKESNERMLICLSEISTLTEVVPQGAISSPAISNIIFRQLDIRISDYCKKVGITYTRYADDLLFSSDTAKLHAPFFKKKLYWILASRGFRINNSKLRESINMISLNGFVVDKNIRISRSKRSDLFKIVYLFNQRNYQNINEFLKEINNSELKYKLRSEDGTYFESKSELVHYLSGYRSFLIAWLPERTQKSYYKVLKKKIDKVEKIINGVIQLN